MTLRSPDSELPRRPRAKAASANCAGKQTPEQYHRLYVGHMQYVNSRLEKMLDDILANSLIPPIIVLQGEHGPGMMMDQLWMTATCLRERFSILAASRLPGLEPDVIPFNITPVKSFRIILRSLDVTARVDQICATLQPPSGSAP